MKISTPVVAMALRQMPTFPDGLRPEATPTDLRDVPEVVEDDLTVPVTSPRQAGAMDLRAPLGVQYASALRPSPTGARPWSAAPPEDGAVWSTGTTRLVAGGVRSIWIVLAIAAIALGALIAVAVH